VILATDGDFNVGLKTEQELAELITSQKESRVYLTCLGVGMGNYKDSKIHMLAEKGNGNFAYLDNYQEAEKVLLKEFTQTLYSVADNVYMDVAFNPDWVKDYRLIGFDNKVGALRDSLSSVEGGEIGSGHSMLAIFEITPTDNNKNAVKDNFTSGTLADIILKYQLPDDTARHQFIYKSHFDFVLASELEKCFHFSAAVAMFGSLLRSSPFLKNIGWNEIIALAQTSSESNNLLQKDFLTLLQQAKILYSKGKKKRGRG
jgi:Ca-activated chloride channel family protein